MDYQKYSQIYIDAGLAQRSKARYAKRRAHLAAKIGHLTVIYGQDMGPGNGNPWSYADERIFQEPLLIHLTGVNQLKTALLLDPNDKKNPEVLFVTNKNPQLEFWEGLRFGVGSKKAEKEITQVTGIKQVMEFSQLFAEIEKRLKAKKDKTIGTLRHVSSKGKHLQDSNEKFYQELSKFYRKKKWSVSSIKNIKDIQWQERLPLDEVDIKNTRKANLITIDSFKALLKKMKELKSETNVRGYLEGQMLMQSPYGLSFPTIAANGGNATILHYVKNDEALKKNQLILLDFGSKWMSMHADISRTIPVNGKFNPLQKLLYQICLDAQLLVEKKAKVGVTIKELNDVCWNHINGALKDAFDKKGKYQLKYDKNPHGVSHLMGEQEHDGDPFGEYKELPMQENWLISNEPGIYGTFQIKIGNRSYKEDIGIRIEDDLLIKKNKCINMSAGCPKTISEIEKLMK